MKKIYYCFMVLLGGTLYGTMSSFVKMSYAKGFNAAELSFWQALIAALILGVCCLTSSQRTVFIHQSRKQACGLMLTGSAIGLTNFLYYLSVSYIPASLAIVILMQFTWFSILMEWLIFKQKPSRIELTTAFVIWIGTIVAGNLTDTGLMKTSWKGIALAAFSSLSYSAYIVANSRVGRKTGWQTKSTLIMTGSAFTILLINIPTLMNESHYGMDLFQTVLFLAVFGTTIPTALFSAGIPKIGAAVSSILMTIEFPIALICAHIVLNEKLSLLQIAGVVFMLAAICTMNYHKNTK
jgi:drug/metabolite transporter (DMT)-like permease